jgi:RNA polymerase sigma-70 factor (ECF subfamily)
MPHLQVVCNRIGRLHASAVFRLAWGLCGDRTRAEDLVSETFVRLLTRAPKIRTQPALAYLLAAARNIWLTSRGRQKREVPLTVDLVASGLDPGQRLDDQARLRVVLDALGSLPEGERAATTLTGCRCRAVASVASWLMCPARV